jgi:hypothetical protein
MVLLLTTASEDEFLKRACELWFQVHEGDNFPETESMRSDVAGIRRKLAGEYTKAEREAIGAAAFELLD